MKKPTPAQLAARARFAEMVRSGAFKRKAKRKANPSAKSTTYYVHANLGYGKSEHFKVTTSPGANSARSAANQVANRLGYPVFVSSRNERPTSEGLPVVRYEFIDDAQTKAVDLFVYPIKREGLKYTAIKANPSKRKKTVSQKISQLMHEGYPQKQAVAVALSEQRAGKVKATPRKRNPITETLIYGLPAGETRDYMEDLLYDGGLKLTPEQIQKVLDAATAAGYHSFRVTGFDPTVGAAFVRTMGQTRQRKRNPATGRKASRTKLNPVAYRDLAKELRSDAKVAYAVHFPDRPSYHAIAYYSKKADAMEVAQETSDRIGKPLAVSRVQIYFGQE